MRERRRFKRVEFKSEGHLRTKEEGKKIFIILRDISPEGLGFASFSLLKPSQIVEVEIKLDGHFFRCKAEVIWINTQDDKRGPRYIGGLKIQKISNPDKTILLVCYIQNLLLKPQTVLVSESKE